MASSSGSGLAISGGAATETMSQSHLFLPELICQADCSPSGYALGAFGKWHITRLYNAGETQCHPIEAGFDVFDGNLGNADSSQTSNHYRWPRTIASDSGTCEAPQCSNASTAEILECTDCSEQTCTLSWDATVGRKAAVNWLASIGSSPFFLYYAPNPPHARNNVPPLCYPGVPSQRTRQVLDQYGLTEGEGPRDATGWDNLDEDTKQDIRRTIVNACVEVLDYELGLLFDACPEEDTVFIVISDNGTSQSWIDEDCFPICHGKRSMYQLGVRVPLIVKGPSTLIHPDQHVDLWRTIGNIVGISNDRIDCLLTENGIDGDGQGGLAHDSRTFLPELWGGTTEREVCFAEFFTPNNGPCIDPASCFDPDARYRMVTDGRYKLIWRDFVNPAPDTLGCEEEFYDLIADPQELTPLCSTIPVCSSSATGPCPRTCCPIYCNILSQCPYLDPGPIQDAYNALKAEMIAISEVPPPQGQTPTCTR